MTKVEIPFAPSVARKIFGGKKCTTIRDEQLGLPGDKFIVSDGGWNPYKREYRLLDVVPSDLNFARDWFFRLDGFKSPEQFEKVWRDLHQGTYETGRVYYVHFFVRSW